MGLKKCLLALKLLVPVSMQAVGLHFHAFSRFWTVSRSTAKFGGVYIYTHFSVVSIWHAFGFLQLWVPIGCLTFVFLWPGFSFTFGCIFEFVFVHFVASGAGKH